MGEKESYFFSLRDRKYPTGLRSNRATDAGYWKATGKDREVMSSHRRGCLVGMKKTLVFYKGRAPRGEKTNWIMHEYRLEGDSSLLEFSRAWKDEWVVCRIFRKNKYSKKFMVESSSSYGRPYTKACLPPLLESPNRACTEEGGTDNEINGIHGDISYGNPEAAKQSNNLKNTLVSEGGDANTGVFAGIAPHLRSPGEGLGTDVSRVLGLQQQSVLPSAAAALPLASFVPFQASSLPASSLVLKALLEQYSIAGTQCKIEACEEDAIPRSSENPILNRWSMEGNLQHRRSTFANQLEMPVQQAIKHTPLASMFNEVFGDAQHSNAYGGFSRNPTEEMVNKTDLESFWTY